MKTSIVSKHKNKPFHHLMNLVKEDQLETFVSTIAAIVQLDNHPNKTQIVSKLVGVYTLEGSVGFHELLDFKKVAQFNQDVLAAHVTAICVDIKPSIGILNDLCVLDIEAMWHDFQREMKVPNDEYSCYLQIDNQGARIVMCMESVLMNGISHELICTRTLNIDEQKLLSLLESHK